MPSLNLSDADQRQRAFDLIRQFSFRRGTFTLASGKQSNFYLDLKPTMLHPEGCTLLAHLLFKKIAPLHPDLVGGIEMGAVPLISPVSMVSLENNMPIAGFFVRKGAKDHGTKKLFETALPVDGKKVVIVEDVTTTGGSAMEAVKVVRGAGANVLLVLSIVDREDGAEAFFAGQGVAFDSMFKVSEFMRD